MDRIELTDKDLVQLRANIMRDSTYCEDVDAALFELQKLRHSGDQPEKLRKVELYILNALEDLSAPMADDETHGAGRAMRQLTQALKILN